MALLSLKVKCVYKCTNGIGNFRHCGLGQLEVQGEPMCPMCLSYLQPYSQNDIIYISSYLNNDICSLSNFCTRGFFLKHYLLSIFLKALSLINDICSFSNFCTRIFLISHPIWQHFYSITGTRRMIYLFIVKVLNADFS